MKRFLPLVLAGLFVFFVLPSMLKIWDLRKKNEDYARQIVELRRQTVDLKEELRRLKTDPVYLERVAREKMGLTKENEVIYKITPDKE